jgi:hypothetical protein
MTEKEMRLYYALKRITKYDPPERLRKHSEHFYGLSYQEALEMAYDNVLNEAKSAIRGMRSPAAKMPAKDTE